MQLVRARANGRCVGGGGGVCGGGCVGGGGEEAERATMLIGSGVCSARRPPAAGARSMLVSFVLFQSIGRAHMGVVLGAERSTASSQQRHRRCIHPGATQCSRRAHSLAGDLAACSCRAGTRSSARAQEWCAHAVHEQGSLVLDALAPIAGGDNSAWAAGDLCRHRSSGVRQRWRGARRLPRQLRLRDVRARA